MGKYVNVVRIDALVSRAVKLSADMVLILRNVCVYVSSSEADFNNLSHFMFKG